MLLCRGNDPELRHLWCQSSQMVTRPPACSSECGTLSTRLGIRAQVRAAKRSGQETGDGYSVRTGVHRMAF
ncbi:hypothetical protein E1301_Tti010141 [Triplophysa tibetana]|uniref:Uncharacterized protein n=1 Tax=Triplophysa tibetana TaxID=1572043 RepID=A0A5A9P2V8_9TELE|nr:hypothetical protein E1301_Tti010141 [Triplophysa tibetana]